MYEYLYAVGNYQSYLPGYHIVDISEYRVCDLEKLFKRLTIVIQDNFYKRVIAIELDTYKDTFALSEDTISEFLITQENQPLLSHTRIPENKYQQVKWESLFHKGLHHYPANVNLANDTQHQLTADYAPDIRLYYEKLNNVDYKKINQYSLFIVNGSLVRSFANKDAIYLLGAGRDYQSTKLDTYISALNFEHLGKVNTIDITEENLIIKEINGHYRYFFTLDKDIDLNQHFVLLSFNGQFCFDSEIIHVNNQNVIEFHPEQIDLLQHHFTYQEVTRVPKWTDQTKKMQYIKDALLMHNSFIITIDNPTLGIEMVSVSNYLYPGAFQTKERFEYPVILENGILPHLYRRNYGYRERIVNFTHPHLYERVIDSVGTLSTDLVYDDINKGQSGRLINAFILKITGINYVG